LPSPWQIPADALAAVVLWYKFNKKKKQRTMIFLKTVLKKHFGYLICRSYYSYWI